MKRENNKGMEWRYIKWEINKEWWWDGNEEEVNKHSLYFNIIVLSDFAYRAMVIATVVMT